MSSTSIAEKVARIIRMRDVFVSDIHIKRDCPVTMRTPTRFVALDDDLVTDEDINAFLSLPPLGREGWRAHLEKEGGGFEIAHTMSDSATRIRINVYEEGGENRTVAGVIRIQPVVPGNPEELGLPPIVKKLAEKSKGLLIFAGPTGSGKTTSMGSIIDYLNSSRSSHIMTVERPIEYVHSSKRSLISQREVPTNIGSFGAALEASLRQRPDVIAIGEVTDKETVDAMLHASDSGHFVMATMHTRNADDTITRLLGFYSGQEHQQKLNLLSSTLVGIVVQALAPSLDGKGVHLATEILINNNASAQAIRENKTHTLRHIMSQGRGEGMYTLNQSLAQMLAEGRISLRDASFASYDDAELATLVR